MTVLSAVSDSCECSRNHHKHHLQTFLVRASVGEKRNNKLSVNYLLILFYVLAIMLGGSDTKGKGDSFPLKKYTNLSDLLVLPSQPRPKLSRFCGVGEGSAKQTLLFVLICTVN